MPEYIVAAVGPLPIGGVFTDVSEEDFPEGGGVIVPLLELPDVANDTAPIRPIVAEVGVSEPLLLAVELVVLTDGTLTDEL